MSITKKLTTLFIAAFIMIAGVNSALADSDGTYGAVTRIQVMTSGSNNYAYYRYLVVVAGVDYFSGGSYCTGVDSISEAAAGFLHQYMIHGININPIYKTVGSNKCITGWAAY